MQMNSNIKECENLFVDRKTLSTALGFEPRSFDCRSTILLKKKFPAEVRMSLKIHFRTFSPTNKDHAATVSRFL